MGYLRGLVHGTIVGTVVGLCIAPQDGRQTREQLQRAATAIRQGALRAQDTARRVAPTVQGAAQSMGGVVGTMRGRLQRESEEEPLIPVNGGSRQS